MEADFGFNFNKFLSFSFVGFNWSTDSKMGLYFVFCFRLWRLVHTAVVILDTRTRLVRYCVFFTLYVFQITIGYLSNLK